MNLLSVLVSFLLALQPANFTVTGKVVDATDNSPLVAADVLVTDMDDKVLVYGATDGEG